ncbi:MAG: hypothetical protein Q8S84_09185 [bacterium]|nr:hypothetical protein [bacterium]
MVNNINSKCFIANLFFDSIIKYLFKSFTFVINGIFSFQVFNTFIKLIYSAFQGIK